MNRMINLSGAWLVVAALLLAIVACAGMKKSPEDTQKQAFDDFRAKVADVIEDPEREAQAIALVSGLEESFFDIREVNAEEIDEVRRLNADYDAAREDIESVLGEIIARVRSEHRDVVDAHRQLRKIMTQEEWDAVEKSKSRAITAAFKAIRAE